MLLQATSGSAVIARRILWTRCGFSGTALLDDTVALAPAAPVGAPAVAGDFSGGFAGLSFDRHCRVFHPRADGSLEYALWGKQSSLRIQQDQAHVFVITGAESETGSFGSQAPLPKSVLATACDQADYLYLADPQSSAVWIIDTWQHETARLIQTPAKPRDLAFAQGLVYCLTDSGCLTLSPCDPPAPLSWPALAGADRLDVHASGRAFVLLGAGRSDAELVCLNNIQLRKTLPFATDFLLAEDDPELGLRLVVAHRPGEEFSQLRLLGRHFSPLPNLQAPQYDGRGIALAPDNRIAYWTSRGLRHAAPARSQYQEQGWLFGFALDSDLDQTHWGTLRLQACIPAGTDILFYALSRDDLDFPDPITRTAPAGEALAEVALESSRPLASQAAWLQEQKRAPQTLFRTPSALLAGGAEAASEVVQAYEAPIIAGPGRYLWLVFELRGTRSKTPRLYSVQADYPAHDWVGLLPRTLWREPAAQNFLTRYLAPLAAMMSQWGEASDSRHTLFDGRTAPVEALNWVGQMLGLALESCWSERAQRQMLQEITSLFRSRGTLGSLKRMLEILTNAQVIIIEKFRLRGGGVLGNPQATQSQSVLGLGFRVGGSIGKETETELVLAEEAFDDFAHRFNVTLVANLSAEQLACVQRLIETHKPAHTHFDLCTLATGLRVGLGLHLGVTSAVGRSSGFDLVTLGDSVLGKGYVLGRPQLDASVDSVPVNKPMEEIS